MLVYLSYCDSNKFYPSSFGHVWLNFEYPQAVIFLLYDTAHSLIYLTPPLFIHISEGSCFCMLKSWKAQKWRICVSTFLTKTLKIENKQIKESFPLVQNRQYCLSCQSPWRAGWWLELRAEAPGRLEVVIGGDWQNKKRKSTITKTKQINTIITSPRIITAC